MNRAYPDRPWVGIGVVVVRGGDQVLLIRRARPPNQGQWSLPGGAQDLGETVFAGAAREVLEETGLTVRPRAIVTAVDSLHRDGEGRVQFHYTLVEVLADWVSGEAKAQDDAAAAGWFTWDAAEQAVDWGETRRVLQAARQMVGAA